MPAPMYDFPSPKVTHSHFINPEYHYWSFWWKLLRDSVVGEIEVKRKGELYLPRMPDMSNEEYIAYTDRAVFFNMTQRTLTGLMGTLFRRNPIISGLPTHLDTSDVSKNGQTLGQFVKEAAAEVMLMGRYGTLLDM